MMRVDDLVEAISALQRNDLEVWIREELVTPRHEAGRPLFTDMECARVRLICTLHYELEIDAGTLPVVEEPELVAFLETWQPKTQQDPRKEMLP